MIHVADTMTVLLVVMLLVCLCTHRLNASVYCSEKPFVNFPFNENDICIEMDEPPSFDMSKGYTPNSSDIKKSLDKTNGVLEIRFPLDKNASYQSYTLELTYIKPVNNTCPNTGFIDHSSYIFNMNNCSDFEGFRKQCAPNCSRMGVVKFNYIFTACYQIVITAENTENENKTVERYINGKLELLETSYKKQLVLNTTSVPIIEHDCRYNEDGQELTEVEGTFIRHGELAKLPGTVSLMLRKGNDNCSRSGKELACCNFNAAGKVLYCYPNNMASPDYCELGSNFLKCSFKNPPPGNYCLMFRPYDSIRCQTRWVNGSRCLREQFVYCRKHEPVHLPDPLPHKPNNDYIYIVTAVLLAVCFVVAGISYVICRKRRRPRPYMDLYPLPTPISNVHPCVLLLYAQDCKEFMKLMGTFRSLLSNVGQCVVLDCFDPEQENKIASNPKAWMRHNASSPQVKVVLVASECAVGHQLALEKDTKLIYLEPEPHNNLFQHGLQEVMNNPERQYTNTFVVRFDTTDLKYITSFTRYTLPLYLEDLLNSLNPSLDLSNMEEFTDVQKLRDHHAEMMRFKKDHPTYFTKLIVKAEDPVNV